MMRERYLAAYRWMLLARISEEKYANLYRAGKIYGGVFIGKGQEAISVATALALQKGDIFAPLIRDQAGRLAFGESLLDATRTYLGSRLGPMRGRDGNVHRGKPREGTHGDDQPSGSDDFRGIRRADGAAGKRGDGRHRRRVAGRRRDLDRRISRGDEPGRRREAAAGGGGDEQSVRLLDADLAAICLPEPRGARRGIWHRRAHARSRQ